LRAKRDPKRRGRPFTCTSCHDPHSSNSLKLFRFRAKTPRDICVNCHKK
jgi:predicted CXXCH cytochrome family protein